MESNIDAAARFEVNRFMYACAGTIAGPTLTDSQQHTLFHQFKKVLEDAEYKIKQARKAPPGHIIDDAGQVMRIVGSGICRPMTFGLTNDVVVKLLAVPVNSEAAEAAKDGKA